MKHIISHSLLLMIFTGIFSCKKDPINYLDGGHALTPEYHVSFYDHKTGENIPGLEADLIGINTYPIFGGFTIVGPTIQSDAKGAFSFKPISGCKCNQYLKISNPYYVEALYSLNEKTDPTSLPNHTQEGSGGPNVVYVKLLRKEGNNLYLRAELYRKVLIDIRIRQVSVYSDTLQAIFNAAINGTDPSNSANYFGMNDLLGEGIKLYPNKKIDTTIKVYAFGDYLNKIRWSVYANVFIDPVMGGISKKFINTGDLEEKIFPSDIPNSITITF
jgi:hypothetical protein